MKETKAAFAERTITSIDYTLDHYLKDYGSIAFASCFNLSQL